jgi:heptosyltransferase-2
MNNILIIKTDATGDVLRTSVLLHVLKGNVYWITAAYNIPLFPDDVPHLSLIPSERIPSELLAKDFDLVINLEEDIELARQISKVNAKKTVGVYYNDGKLDYSTNSAEWFDMSLVSKFPSSYADELKKKNRCSYQEIIYRILGKNFNDERYIAYRKNNFKKRNFLIGIEKRAGNVWPNKNWYGYDELINILHQHSYETMVFEARHELRNYLDDINDCSVIICGDTLAMHVALAYNIPCISIFNCTSPNEIYDYGILRKVVSCLLEQCFYRKEYLDEVTRSVPITSVLNELQIILTNSPAVNSHKK